MWVVARNYNLFQVIPDDDVQLNEDPDKFNQQPEQGPESHLKVGVLGNYEPYIEPRIGPGQNYVYLQSKNNAVVSQYPQYSWYYLQMIIGG